MVHLRSGNFQGAVVGINSDRRERFDLLSSYKLKNCSKKRLRMRISLFINARFKKKDKEKSIFILKL